MQQYCHLTVKHVFKSTRISATISKITYVK